jgi:hydrogenase/urease accessory protein HupE
MLYAKAIVRLTGWFLLLLLVAGTTNGRAHTTSVTSIDARLTTTNITLSLQLMQPDLLQIAREGPKDKFYYDNQEDFRTNAAWIAQYVSNRVAVSFDGTNSATVISNWPPANPELTIEVRPDDLQPAPLSFDLSWKIPPAAKELKLVFNLYDTPGFSALFQILFDLGPEAMPVMHVVPGGKETVIDLVALAEDLPEEPVPAPPPPSATTTNQTPAGDSIATNQPSTTVSPEPAAKAESVGKAIPRAIRFNAAEFIRVGFVHILPRGLDHILFVLALFLLNTNWRPLLWQVTAFTIAHSLTLALAMNNVISVSPKIVEPIIALSIAAVAIENLFQNRLSRWRWIGVFLFGMIHGLGFAGVLGEMQIPDGYFGWSLLWFNVGVELGQLAVIAMAWIVIVGKSEQPWYPKYFRNPACWCLAAFGLYWTIERIFF